MWIYPICPLVAICWTWMKQSTSWPVVPYTVSFQACFLEANIGRLRPPPPSWRARVILKWRSGVETLAFWNHKHTFYQRFALQTNEQYKHIAGSRTLSYSEKDLLNKTRSLVLLVIFFIPDPEEASRSLVCRVEAEELRTPLDRLCVCSWLIDSSRFSLSWCMKKYKWLRRRQRDVFVFKQKWECRNRGPFLTYLERMDLTSLSASDDPSLTSHLWLLSVATKGPMQLCMINGLNWQTDP